MRNFRLKLIILLLMGMNIASDVFPQSSNQKADTLFVFTDNIRYIWVPAFKGKIYKKGDSLLFSMNEKRSVLDSGFKIQVNDSVFDFLGLRIAKYCPVIIYSTAGIKICEGTYQFEGFQDKYREFYPNGKLKCCGYYDIYNVDVKVGYWKYYKKNGELRKTKMFSKKYTMKTYSETHPCRIKD